MVQITNIEQLIMKNLKVGIVGHGFVGKAVDFGFSVNVDKIIIEEPISVLIPKIIPKTKKSTAALAKSLT